MRRKRIILYAGGILGIILVAAAAVLIARIPTAAAQLLPNTSPILVVLSHPAEGSEWPSDTPIPVAVMVTGQAGLASVELWIDGRLFDTQTPPDGRTMFYHAWSWLPLTEGTHALFVRALDANGRTADSNAVHILASAPAGLIMAGTAQGGETFQSLAEQNGLSADQIAAVNPALDPAAPIPPGTRFFLPALAFTTLPGGESSNVLPPTGPVDPAEEGGPSGAAFFLDNALRLNKNTPSAPELSASVGICNVTLTIEDTSENESGFFVYALTEASVSFKRIAGLEAHAGTGMLGYTVPSQRGNVQFYVSAYNPEGESPSAPVAVSVTNPQCNPSQGDQGGLKYAGGFLTLPPDVQLAYFYASINGGESQRIPEGHDFFEPVTGQIDLRDKIQQWLGKNSAGEVDLDVWGWSEGALVHVGKIHIYVNFASLEICNLGADCSGDMGSTHWVTEAVVGSDKTAAVRAFRWSAYGSDIRYAIWQVSTQPFPVEYSVGAPPGLVISGISEAEVNVDSGIAGGEFQIDFSADLQFSPENQSPLTLQKTIHFWQSNDFENLLLPDLAEAWSHPLNPDMLQILVTRQLYIRATPMAGGHPASDPSNTVQVTYTPTGEQPPVHIYNVPTYKVEIVPDSYVNEVKVVQKIGILGCSDITGVDHDVYVNWYKQSFAIMPGLSESTKTDMAEKSYQWWADRIGWEACPGIVELPEDTVWDDLGAAFKDFFNTLSSTLEMVKGTLVDALASIIPGCDSTCKTLLMTGLNFTITYFTGLPPSIPNFDEAVGLGIDYAVQLAISQSGIPYCDQTCQEAISGEIKSVADDVAKSGKSQPGCSAQEFTYWVYEGTQLYHLKPLCFPPGVFTEPVEGSMYEKAMVQVRVTRIDGSPEPAPMQNLVVDTTALNEAYGDGHSETGSFNITTEEHCVSVDGHPLCSGGVNQTINYTMVHNAPLAGVPFPQTIITVPILRAGQSVVIPVVFESNTFNHIPPNVYFPRLFAVLAAYPAVDLNTVQVDWWRDFLHLTDSGAVITIDAKVLCRDKAMPSIWNSPCSEIDVRPFIVP